MVEAWWLRADRAVAALVASGRWLALPVSFLLCIQWPLRDVVQAHSIEANDLAQCLFALYVSLAVTDATREQAHLVADAFAQRWGALNRRRIAKAAALCCLVPWSLFVLVVGAPMVWRSIARLESFPETYSAGYFIIKASVWLLALLVLAQALLDIARPGSRE